MRTSMAMTALLLECGGRAVRRVGCGAARGACGARSAAGRAAVRRADRSRWCGGTGRRAAAPRAACPAPCRSRRGEPCAHRIDSPSGPEGLVPDDAGTVRHGQDTRTTLTGSSVTAPSTMRNERNWKARPRRVRGGHQDVVGARLVGVGDVGAGRVRLGRGVRVVDDHRLLVAVVHLAVELEQVARSRTRRRWATGPRSASG